MTLVIAVLKCSLPKVEMLEELICQKIIQKFGPNTTCALVPMLPIPLESYVLASFVAYKAQHKRIARKYSLEILSRLLAHRQISDILSIVRDLEFSKRGHYLLILHINNTIDVDNLHRQFRELLSNTSCSLTDAPQYSSYIDRITIEYIHTFHGIPEERIEFFTLISIAGCSAILV